MYLFAQAACVQTDSMLETKKVWGLAAACFGLAICMIFRVSMVYLLNMDEINSKIYDMKLVTVTDYAVMGQIPKACFEKFKVSQNLDQALVGSGNVGNVITRFRDSLIDSIEL